MRHATAHRYGRLIRLATAFDDATEGDEAVTTVEVPEDLSELSDAEVDALLEQVRAAFDEIDDDAELTDELVGQMEQLAEAVSTINAEQERRSNAAEERRARADAIRERVRGDDADDDGEEASAEDDDEPEASDEEGDEPAAEDTEDEPEAADDREPIAASSRSGPLSIRVPSRRTARPAPAEAPATGRSALLAAAGLSHQIEGGSEITTDQAAEAIHARANGISDAQLRQAARSGNRFRQSFPVLSVRRGISEELTASSDSEVSDVIARATDPARLPGGSLTAAGWCAPSETRYNLYSIESTEGLLSLPEIGVERAGIQFTPGPDFRTIFDGAGFGFTEEDADPEEGDPDYGGGAGEPKPVYKVPCPDFTEQRLQVDGVWITAGILQNRAYPEMTTRVVDGALVAHEHKIDEKVIAALVAQSTSVAMPSGQVGAVAPILTALELQAEHTRYVHRAGRGSQIEAVLPFWARGAMRSDLSRRLGVDLNAVSDARLAEYLSERQIVPQWSYNYQPLTGDADAQTAWPDEVSFLLYPAGTFVRASNDIITLESVFDSALFAYNDYTALFTEEGWLVAKVGHDSREVTVPISANGATHGGVEIAHDGSAVTA